MNINTKGPIGALVISGIILLSFRIGIEFERRSAPKTLPKDTVIASGYAAKIVNSHNFVTFSNRLYTKKEVLQEVAKMNERAFDSELSCKWEFVEIFYRRVEG